jgi:molybdenum cofactor guanylyltransferase
MAPSRDEDPGATRAAEGRAGHIAGGADLDDGSDLGAAGHIGDAGGPMPRVGGAVLAGGRSRRMGRDKAGIEVAGATLLERARAAVATALGPRAAVVAVGTPAAPHPGAWIPDRRPGAGPLAGLEAALGWAQGEGLDAVLLVGVDHPWLEAQVLRLLVDRLPSARPPEDPLPARRATASGPHGVVLGTADGPLLLLGVYRTDALPVVAGLLDDGERRLQALRLHLDLEVVPPAAWRHLDPDGATAVDVDAPADLDTARRHLDADR